MDALKQLCLRRLGYSPDSLSPNELKAKLGDIIHAVFEESVATKSQVELIQKAAYEVATSIPNPGIVRDESISQSVPDSPDLFSSVFPAGE
jgi:hypothetical protein